MHHLKSKLKKIQFSHIVTPMSVCVCVGGGGGGYALIFFYHTENLEHNNWSGKCENGAKRSEIWNLGIEAPKIWNQGIEAQKF